MKSDPGKYCLVLNSLAATGGVELRTLEFARYLREKGRHPEILVLRRNGPSAKLFEQEGFVVHDVSVYVQNSQEFRVKPLGLLRLWAFLLKNRYGVLVGLIPPSSYLLAIASLPKFGRGLVIMERETPRRVSRFYKCCNNLISYILDYRVCVSEFLRDRILQTSRGPAKRVITIENGTEVLPHHHSEKIWREKLDGKFVFGFLGRLESSKAPDIAIRAFADLKERMPHAEIGLLIVGTGTLEKKLQALIRELHMEDHIHLAGFQKHPQDFFRLFDAFLMPSLTEGLGTVWIEAISHRVPVIVSDLRPLNDYIRHRENGLLFEPGNVKALSELMQELLDDPDLAATLRESGFVTYHKNFQLNEQIHKLFEICEKARKTPYAAAGGSVESPTQPPVSQPKS